MGISIFVKTEEAPALNFLIRVLTPIVYIIIVSTILYYYHFDKYVANIYLVCVYYIIFRLCFNLFTNRGLLINWYRQYLYWGAIIIISYFTYDKLIRVKTNILPDFTSFANELWIIILIFVFQVSNNIRLSQDGAIKRKQKYLKSRLNHLKTLYGKTIKEATQNEALEIVVYAILIYEDFNRPKVVRIIENIKQRLTKKPHTLGVMQVRSDKIISDLQSVKLGTKKIVEIYQNYLDRLKTENCAFYEYSAYVEIISNYNGGSSYHSEITDLISTIRESFYKNIVDTLEPKIKNVL